MKITALVEALYEQPLDAEAFVEVGPDGIGLAIWQEGERIEFIELTDEDEDGDA